MIAEPERLPERVYDAASGSSAFYMAWRPIGREMLEWRGLTWRLFVRDLSARYRQSVLGYFWALFPPVIVALVFTFLKSQRVLELGETRIPYPAYVIGMMMLWHLFAGGLLTMSRSLVVSRGLLEKVFFPRECLVFAAFGATLFDTLLRLVLVGVVFAWYGVVPGWGAALLPLAVLPLLAFTVGLGFLLSVANVLLRDIDTALPTLLGLAMFTAPVVYPPPTTFPWTLINDVNPISALLVGMYDLALTGSLTRPLGYTVAAGLSLAVLWLSWLAFRFAQPFIAERL